MILKELVVQLGLEVDEKAFDSAHQRINSFASTVATLGTAAVAAAAAGLAHITREASEYGEAFSKLSQQTGIGTESLQKLAFAAEMADVPMQSLKVGLSKLAKEGVQDLEGGLLALADQFEKMPDGGAKLALAQEKFGKAGRDFIPFLNKGRKGMEEWLKKANEFGLVLSPEEIANAEKFNDQLKEINGAFRGLRIEIGKTLFELLDGEEITKWIVTARKQIKRWITDMGGVRVIAERLWAIAKVIGVVVGAFYTLQKAVAAYQLIASGAALASAKAWLAALWPVVVLTALIAGLYLVVEDIYTFFQGGESVFGRMFGDQAEALRILGFFGDIKERIKDIVDLGTIFGRMMLALGTMDFSKALQEAVNFSQTLEGKKTKLSFAAMSEEQKAQLTSRIPLPNEAKAQLGLPVGQATNTTSVQAPVTINVTAGPGMNTTDLAKQIELQFRGFVRDAVGEAKK